jgi:hypothetical protein
MLPRRGPTVIWLTPTCCNAGRAVNVTRPAARLAHAVIFVRFGPDMVITVQ